MGDAPSSPTHDLTLLSIIAQGLSSSKGRKEFSTFGSDLDRRQARVLDSLAYLLVSREEKQVVAVGLRLRDEGPGLELLVSDSGDCLQATLTHSIHIVRRLRDIHLALPLQDKPSRIDTLPTSDPDSYLGRLIIDLERAIIEHSRIKLLHRFRKHSRYRHFLDTARDVYGLPVAARADITDDIERAHLRTLQTSELFPRDEFESQLRVIGLLGNNCDVTVDGLRLLLHSMAGWKERIQRINSYRRSWDAYTSCRLKRLQSDSSDDKHSADVAHWLSKITEIREHFNRLIEGVLSPKLAPILLDIVGARQITSVPPVQRSPSVVLDYDELRLVLDTSNAGEVRRFLRGLQATQGGTWLDASEEKLVLNPGLVHPECQILAHIHSRPALPYIAVSKLSCARCDMYLSVYRSKTGANIYTRGTSGQITQWRYPSLGSSEKALAIEKLIRSRLLNMIWHGWEDYSRPPPDVAEQQTADEALQAAWARLETGLESFRAEPQDDSNLAT
ncbi:unnamed protein product [Peniophora sp. CBMAI 1063]|nr:unnamed protein product [Peniophora sp. CBMAI 1063]